MDEEPEVGFMDGINPQDCDRLGELVEELTTSGEPKLDEKMMKELKKICKKNDKYVKMTYKLVFGQLEKEHSEIRLSAFQIMSELFVRSHCFRDLFLKDFQQAMDLTLETDPNYPLPPPKPAAKKLKEETMIAIQAWQEKFGAHYKQLSLGYNYLRTCKKVDFEAGVAQTLAEQRRAQLIREKHEKMIQKQLENALAELQESKAEIRNTLQQAESCLQLLWPNPEEFSFPALLSDGETESTENKNNKEVKTTQTKDTVLKDKRSNDARDKRNNETGDKRNSATDKRKTSAADKDKSQNNEETDIKGKSKKDSNIDRHKNRDKSSSDSKNRSDSKSNSNRKSSSESDRKNSSHKSKSNDENTSHSKSRSEGHRHKSSYNSRSGEKSHSDKSHNHKSHTNKSISKKSHTDKSLGNKSHSDKSHNDKSHNDKSHSNKSDTDKSHSNKSHHDKSDSHRRSSQDKSSRDKSHKSSNSSSSSSSSSSRSRSSKSKHSSGSSHSHQSKSHDRDNDRVLGRSSSSGRTEKNGDSSQTDETEESGKNKTEVIKVETVSEQMKTETEKNETKVDEKDTTLNKETESGQTKLDLGKVETESENTEAGLQKKEIELDKMETEVEKTETNQFQSEGLDIKGQKRKISDICDTEEDMGSAPKYLKVVTSEELSVNKIKTKEETKTINKDSDSKSDSKSKRDDEKKENDSALSNQITENGITDKNYLKINNITIQLADQNTDDSAIQVKNSSQDKQSESTKDSQTEDKTKLDDSAIKVNDSNLDTHNEKEKDSQAEDIKEDNTDDLEEEEQEADYSEEEVEAGYVQKHGFGAHNFSINIEIRPDAMTAIEENEHNADVLNVLKDTLILFDNKFFPALQKWIVAFTRASSQENIRKALDLKELLETSKKRILKLRIAGKNGQTRNILEEDEDSDFEEVPDDPTPSTSASIPTTSLKKVPSMTESQDRIADLLPKTNKAWNLAEMLKKDTDLDPTSYAAAVKMAEKRMKKEQSAGPMLAPEPGPSTSSGHVDPDAERRRQEALAAAPRLPYNIDLKHWGEEIETPLLLNYHAERRFWSSKEHEDDIVDQSALSAMTTRVMTFTGEFEPVKWACRTPLPNGTLCLRMDRYKCPFHGKVIGRDKMGRPTDPKDIAELSKIQEKKQQENPEWEDPELQREIAAATGVDLARKGRGKAKDPKKGKEKSMLTNIKKIENTGRRRLEKKVFNQRSMARVAGALDQIDQKRTKDKFGDQFHYSLKNK